MIEKLVSFVLFVFLQGMFINGIAGAAEKGYILEKALNWWKHNTGFWGKPVLGCVKCMSSFWGAATYWPAVLMEFGFEWWQVPVFIADVFILVFVNWFLFKRQ